LLAEAAVTGDYGAASELMHRLVDTDPALAEVEWVYGRSLMKVAGGSRTGALPAMVRDPDRVRGTASCAAGSLG
jgi:hypothetical protein